MANITNVPGVQTPAKEKAYPHASARFDLAAALLALWVVGGLFLDGWAHSHGRVDETFFTPWHALLYSGAAATALFLASARFVMPDADMPSCAGCQKAAGSRRLASGCSTRYFL